MNSFFNFFQSLTGVFPSERIVVQ